MINICCKEMFFCCKASIHMTPSAFGKQMFYMDFKVSFLLFPNCSGALPPDVVLR